MPQAQKRKRKDDSEPPYPSAVVTIVRQKMDLGPMVELIREANRKLREQRKAAVKTGA